MIKYAFFLLLLGLMTYCRPADPHQARIERMQKQLEESRASGRIDSNTVLYLARAYESWQVEHPKLPPAPNYLQKAAQLYEAELGDERKAHSVYLKLYERYPKAAQSEEALYKIAVMEHIKLNEPNQARLHYREYLALYPKGLHKRLAEEALLHLTKSEAELYRQVQDSLRVKPAKTDSR